ncbi:VF530 family protein [Erwinia amylovora]
MATHSSKAPLHGVTLDALLTMLVARFGWQQLAERINIYCFKSAPSIKYSLNFLRRTPGARKEVEGLYIASRKDNHSATPEMPTDNPWNRRQRKD